MKKVQGSSAKVQVRGNGELGTEIWIGDLGSGIGNGGTGNVDLESWKGEGLLSMCSGGLALRGTTARCAVGCRRACTSCRGRACLGLSYLRARP